MRFSPHLPNRLINALVVAFLFTAIGQLIPFTYYKYFDSREYVKVELPVDTDLKVYNPCDRVLLNTRLTSLMPAVVNGSIQLTMVRANDVVTPVNKYDFEGVIIKEGSQPYSATLPIPCTAPDGVYYYEGVLTYENMGVQKHFYFYTGKFNVVTTPLSPKPGRDEVL